MQWLIKVSTEDAALPPAGGSVIARMLAGKRGGPQDGAERNTPLKHAPAHGPGGATSPLRHRIAVTAIVMMAGFAASFNLHPSDFAQDYLAAAAVRAGIDPNTPSAQLAQRFGVPIGTVTSVQMAHPPLVTFSAIPFADLPWAEARILWNFALSLAAGLLVVLAQARCRDIALLAPAWIFGLALGNVDAIVVSLCLLGLSGRCCSVGLCLGAAAALKVYPALLILGLLATRRYRTGILSCVVGLSITIAVSLILGIESLTGWLRFLPHNGDQFAGNMLNLSLTKFAGLFGWKTSLITALGLVAVVLQSRRQTVDPLLAAILLVSPVSWLQSLPLLTNRLHQDELVACSIGSVIVLLGWLSGVGWLVYPCVLASFLTTAIIARIYVRMYRESRMDATPV